MDINVETVNFNASQDLIDHMKEVFEPLFKYHDQITSIDIYLESINDEKADKGIKAKILTPGHETFIHNNAGDFVTSSQTVFDRAKRVLSDLKAKDKSHRENRPDKVY